MIDIVGVMYHDKDGAVCATGIGFKVVEKGAYEEMYQEDAFEEMDMFLRAIDPYGATLQERIFKYVHKTLYSDTEWRQIFAKVGWIGELSLSICGEYIDRDVASRWLIESLESMVYYSDKARGVT